MAESSMAVLDGAQALKYEFVVAPEGTRCEGERIRGGNLVRTTLIALAIGLIALPALAGQTSSLDYEYFKTKVEPIFLKKRPGHARCIACHGSGTPLRLQPLAVGASNWTDEESQKNFQVVKRVASDGLRSRLLLHPLDERAGGDFYHSGGKHWASQDDPEWQVLKAFVTGATK